MRNSLKRMLAVAAAAAIAAGALSVAACGYQFEPLAGDTQGPVKYDSNGGFVVEKGDYVYFINGVETQEADNTYGTPVKGALMRIKKSDVLAKKNTAEIVVPSLMVAGDYSSGIFIYGERIYYATPNNVRNTSGVIETDYLDFKSANLDGTGIEQHLRISDRESNYRFVEKNEVVYIVYENSSTELHSYNTATDKDTTLVKGLEAYAFSSSDKTDPWVYYTMTVTEGLDSDTPFSPGYNQLYRVSADVTEETAPYQYTWDAEYLEENDNVAPYINLGEIVLDGIGQFDGVGTEQRPATPTQFTHDLESGVVPLSAAGYKYDIQSYANDGVYFTREELTGTSSPGEAGWLYYLAAEDVNAEGWNSITGNSVSAAGSDGALDAVALPANTSKASTSAIFYLDSEGHHHYLYTADNNIYRADVDPNGSGTIINDKDGNIVTGGGNQTGMRIARDVSGATLQFIDRDAAHAPYEYVYFTRSGTSSGGYTVERAVFSGTGKNYGDLPFEGVPQAPYKSVQVLNVQHASGWYPYEVVDGILYFADGETFGGTAYTYISCVDLRNEEGGLLDNEEIAAMNDVWNKLMDSDSKVGYFAKLTADSRSNLATACKYYFYTGETQLFDDNIQEAVDEGKRDDYLYSADEKTAFHEFAEGKGAAAEFGETRLLSYYVTKLGTWSEEDKESLQEYWRTTLNHYTPPEETEAEEGLEDWELALIIIAVVIVAVGAGLCVWFFAIAPRRKAKKEGEKPERFKVDMTVDRNVNVYEPEVEEAEGESAPEAPAEAAEPETAETPAEAAEEAAPEEGAAETDPPEEA